MTRVIRLATKLLSALKVRPGEGLRVGLMFLYSLAAIGGVFIVGRAGGRALFLSTLSQAEIPYKYLLPPIVIVMAVALYTRGAGHFRIDQLTVGTNALMIAVLLVFRLLLETRYGTRFAALAALFVFLELMATLIGIQFSTFAGEIFDPREAKRLFGLIAAGGAVANIIAGGTLITLSSAVAPKNLLFMVMGAVAVCIGCARVLGRIRRTTSAAPAGKPTDTDRVMPDVVLRLSGHPEQVRPQ